MSGINPELMTSLYLACTNRQIEAGVALSAKGLEFLSKLYELDLATCRRETALRLQLGQQCIDAKSPAEIAALVAAELPVRAQGQIAFAQQVLQLIGKTNAGVMQAMQQQSVAMNKQLVDCLSMGMAGPGVTGGQGTGDWSASGLPVVLDQMIEKGKQMAQDWNTHMAHSMSQWSEASSDDIDKGVPKKPAVKVVRA